MVAVGRRYLPRGWADFGRQLAIWFGFVFAYQLARGVADRESPARAVANGLRVLNFETKYSYAAYLERTRQACAALMPAAAAAAVVKDVA